MVYDPREDSEFLAKFIHEHARGHVLDMGTGSGVQAFAALENERVTRVTAVDRDPLAIEYVRERIVSEQPARQRDIELVHGDLFANLEDKRFDTIVFNPPYLPDEETDKDIALYGGPGGFELIVRFLQDARKHLLPGGQILLLISSLSNKERIDRELKHLGYQHEELGMLAMFFERLFVYRLWLP